jgi:hypothetical protein
MGLSSVATFLDAVLVTAGWRFAVFSGEDTSFPITTALAKAVLGRMRLALPCNAKAEGEIEWW